MMQPLSNLPYLLHKIIYPLLNHHPPLPPLTHSAYGMKIGYERTNSRNNQVKPGFYLTVRQIERPESENDTLRFRPSYFAGYYRF